MDNQIKVSIIVPVYKVEKYLRRSMDSLVNQTLNEIEIICINDGSPDNSLSILREYEAKEKVKKIVIIDKQNEGVWKGRFDGIRAATGEYITFVDSDDYVTLDYAEKLYNEAKRSGSDISISGFYRVDVDTEHIYSTEMTKHEGEVIELDKNPEGILSVNTALWNKLYKAEVLKNLKTLENPPRILDDMMFLLLAYLNTNKITFIKDPLYYYMVRTDSIMGQIKKEQVKDTQDAMVRIKNIYKETEKGKSLEEIIDLMAFIHFGISLMLRLSSDKTCNFKEEMKSMREYLAQNFSLWRKSKYINIFYSITHKFSNFKIAIIKKIYVLNLYGAFLRFYKFITGVLKIDIKW